jgi:DUF1680 family protein
MRLITISAIILGVIAISCNPRQQSTDSIDISMGWKFRTGDSSAFALPDYDDRPWLPVQTGDYWENQGSVDYDGTAWYRLHIIIPSGIKNSNSITKAVRISLGRISDSDVTYLNGKMIGSTMGRDIDRNYLVPYDSINWDQVNVLAVKVRNRRGNGGLYAGPYEIGSPGLNNFLALEAQDEPFGLDPSGGSVVKRTLNFKFGIPVERIQGTVVARIYDPETKAIVSEKRKRITVGSTTDTTCNLVSKMEIARPYRVDYSFFSGYFTDTLRLNMLYSYIKIPRTDETSVSPVVPQIVPGNAMPFYQGDIKLEGYLNDRLNANLYQRLLNIDEKGILEGYYNRPGKQTWVGEYAGKYLHAASRVWLYSGNDQLKIQMDRIVDILIACQNEDGYLGTYLPAGYWKNWDVWAHKYNLLGLLSYYAATGYKPALESSVRMGDLICRTFGEGPGQLNIIESSAHSGMASTSILEPMTELYRFTGDEKYLNFCYYILKAYDYNNGPGIISTLISLGKVDKVANGKAYEMMSNLTGIVKLYQLTHNEELLRAAENAWKDISAHKLYITGTSSKSELFQDDFVLPADNDAHMGEGCVTTTWLQFTQALYNLTGEPAYMEEIEKTVFNHLLAAENPQTGCVSYYTALQGKKPYRCTINAHCCLASIPRGFAAIPELVYTRNRESGLSINIYSPGEITSNIKTVGGEEVSLRCSVATSFPETGEVEITVNPSVKADFRLALRVPAWTSTYKAEVNGTVYNGIPGRYLNLDRAWDAMTTIKISFDLNLQFLDGGKSYPGYMAVKTGPQVLAVDQSLNPGIEDLDKLTLKYPCKVKPSGTTLPDGWVGSQVYSMSGFYCGKQTEVILVPFADASQSGGDIRVWIRKE